jgi:hypothetical protein
VRCAPWVGFPVFFLGGPLHAWTYVARSAGTEREKKKEKKKEKRKENSFSIFRNAFFGDKA